MVSDQIMPRMVLRLPEAGSAERKWPELISFLVHLS